MPVLINDCPRCGSKKISFDVRDLAYSGDHDWRSTWEAFCICRHCQRSTTFVLEQSTSGYDTAKAVLAIPGTINYCVDVKRFLSLRDRDTARPPAHVTPEVSAAFVEGATCLSCECWNAAGGMFRACIDLATRDLLPTEETEGFNAKTRRDLGLRLPWLFISGRLPADLEPLSKCIREDGNDGVHACTLTKADAEDLCDFTVEMLERIYTEPGRLEEAENRRAKRRAPKTTP